MLHKGPFVQHIPSRSSSGATARGRVDRGRRGDPAFAASLDEHRAVGSAGPGSIAKLVRRTQERLSVLPETLY